MARTAAMRLVELMVLKDDIHSVILFLGRSGNFQFQSRPAENSDARAEGQNRAREAFERLQKQRVYLGLEDVTAYTREIALPAEEDFAEAERLCAASEALQRREMAAAESLRQVEAAAQEASAFSNMKVPYADLDHVSFLTLRIGRIDPAMFDELSEEAGDRAVIVRLGDDATHILAASSKKGRFALDSVLRKYGFVEIEVPKDFMGVPDEVLAGLEEKKSEARHSLEELGQERRNFAAVHGGPLARLLELFSVGMQVTATEGRLESTQMVYRMTGWIPASESASMMRELDELTEGRIAIRQYRPEEVPSVVTGMEKVPVKLHHGTLVGSFERMIFSYGSPLYGTIDPTPFVAMFFTLLFGIMFGDAGQGLVFLLAGVLMALNAVRIPGWNRFAPVFVAIGGASTVMGLLTGEFFATETVLEPFSRWVTGLFGTPRPHILNLSPTGPDYITAIFGIFGLTLAIGFVINSVGLLINIANNISRGRSGRALFGKTGLAGALFFWYAVCLGLRVAFLHHAPAAHDWIIIGVTVFFAAFGEPFERLADGERPVMENGMGALVIGGMVEIIELISTYLSSSISFVRVGAFALAHAVLGFIISMMTERVGGIGGVLVLLAGNAIVIVLEGMIVAIQVLRLQYYEFFSKFFTETGKEFTPFTFAYKS